MSAKPVSSALSANGSADSNLFAQADLLDPFLSDELLSALPVQALPAQPRAQPRSNLFSLMVNGEIVEALDAGRADFALFEWSGVAEVQVAVRGEMNGASVKPLSLGIEGQVEAGTFRFTLENPANVCVDVPGLKPLFLYPCAPEERKPRTGDPFVRFYAAGAIYEEGTVELKSGETLYIEAGAILRANVICRDATDVRICGYGILDGMLSGPTSAEPIRSILFLRCRDIRVENITMIHPQNWMLVLACCDGAYVRNLKQIGSCMCSDGIDICGSSNVLIEDCCLRNDDDNIAIKSVHFGKTNWSGNVENIRVRRCTFLNGMPGNAMEIGYELRAEYVRDVVFEDIDVLYAHGEGAVFSIHNGDRAVVENIRWENIRVEHYWDKLLDLRVVKARYNGDSDRGRIRNIQLKNIKVMQSICNPGCSVSLISGYTAEDPVRDIVIEDFYLNDKRITSADELDLHTRNAENIVFR